MDVFQFFLQVCIFFGTLGYCNSVIVSDKLSNPYSSFCNFLICLVAVVVVVVVRSLICNTLGGRRRLKTRYTDGVIIQSLHILGVSLRFSQVGGSHL